MKGYKKINKSRTWYMPAGTKEHLFRFLCNFPINIIKRALFEIPFGLSFNNSIILLAISLRLRSLIINPSFPSSIISNDVKITYLSNDLKPNREEFKYALKNKNIKKIFIVF